MATLAERLQIEIERSNTTTGKTDTTVHDAVGSLIDGYGKGGGETGRVIYSDYDEDGLPHTLEYVPAFASDTKLPDKFLSYGHQYTVIGWHSRVENIICPDHITELGIGGFAIGSQVRKTISNYDSIKIAGQESFNGQIIQLNINYLPPNIEYIADRAFGCDPFKDHLKGGIPDSVYYIGASAFIYYSYDECVFSKLPDALEYIGNDAFFNNGFQLFPEDEIVIPQGVETIGSGIFGGSAYRTQKVTFLGKPTNINANAFLYKANNKGSMLNLTEINVPWAEGEVPNAPWGAVNATINYNYNREVSV